MIKQYIRYLLIGLLFGIVLTKTEAVSWFRIQEMFRFHSFHMYGVIGSALVVGMLSTWVIKKLRARTLDGDAIEFQDKHVTVYRYLFGGIIFGLGWALTGACPGPLYILVGHGYSVLLIVLASAIVGTWTYGALRHKLPH